MKLEIAVQDVTGAQAAFGAGADRVELCSALTETGGLTPSLGLISGCLEAATTAEHAGEVHVLIRPRSGGFVYDDTELATAVRDCRAAIAEGAHGVVIGALTPEGAVDSSSLAKLIAAADTATVTFHRAIDVMARPGDALEQLGSLGVDRVLTSGKEPLARDGLELIRSMVRSAPPGLSIVAGGGLTPEDFAAFADSGVEGVHLSAKHEVRGLHAAGPGGGSSNYWSTSSALVATASATLRSLGR